MKAAYRQPNDPAFFDEVAGAVQYALLHALFGLAAAVLNFNRVPAFLTAVVCRVASVCSANYFDDCGVLDFVCARGSGLSLLRSAYDLLGLSPGRSQAGPHGHAAPLLWHSPRLVRGLG